MNSEEFENENQESDDTELPDEMHVGVFVSKSMSEQDIANQLIKQFNVDEAIQDEDDPASFKLYKDGDYVGSITMQALGRDPLDEVAKDFSAADFDPKLNANSDDDDRSESEKNRDEVIHEFVHQRVVDVFAKLVVEPMMSDSEIDESVTKVYDEYVDQKVYTNQMISCLAGAFSKLMFVRGAFQRPVDQGTIAQEIAMYLTVFGAIVKQCDFDIEELNIALAKLDESEN